MPYAPAVGLAAGGGAGFGEWLNGGDSFGKNFLIGSFLGDIVGVGVNDVYTLSKKGVPAVKAIFHATKQTAFTGLVGGSAAGGAHLMGYDLATSLMIGNFAMIPGGLTGWQGQ